MTDPRRNISPTSPQVGPWSNRMRSLSLYLQATVWCIVVLTLALELRRADLRIPFNYRSAVGGDGMFHLGMYKTIQETGWYRPNPSLAAPGTMDVYDFPYIQTGLFGGIKLLTLLTGNVWVAANLFYLATFPLAVWTGLYAFRRLGVGDATAVAVSLLFSLSNYHFFRGTVHTHYTAYYAVPLIGMAALRISLGEPILLAGAHRGPWVHRWKLSRAAAEAAIAALLISLTEAYFAYFSMAILAMAGIIGAIKRQRRASLLDAAFPISIIFVSFALQALPFLLYACTASPNTRAAFRDLADIRRYGLSLNQLLLPSPHHRLGFMARWGLGADEQPKRGLEFFLNESVYSSPLGLVGSAGLIILIVVGVSDSPWFKRRLPSLVNLARLTVATLLFALIGGLSETVFLHVTTLIRCYNRISIFLLFLALLAVAKILDFAVRKRRGLAYIAALVVGTALALLDQIPTGVAPDYAEDRAEFVADREFVREIQSSVPSGSAIFQLPAVWFPEFGQRYEMKDYDHFRGYLHSSRLRWSYGALPGRPTHCWQQEAAALPVPEMVSRLTAAGFSGIYINTKGYENRGWKLIDELRAYLKIRPLAGGAYEELRFFRLPPRGSSPQRNTHLPPP